VPITWLNFLRRVTFKSWRGF